MMLFKKDDPKNKYREVFHAGEAAGLKVTDVRIRLQDMPDGSKKEVSYVEMDTPYTYAGEAVKALAVVDNSLAKEKEGAMPYEGKDASDRIPGLRPYHDCMLMLASNGKNLEDVSERENHTRAFVVMDGNEPVASLKALDRIGQFASAASNYPHVPTFEEYQEVAGYNFSKPHLKEFEMTAGPDEYIQHLDHMYRFSQDPHARLIGKVTTPRQIEQLKDEFQMGQVYEEQARLEKEEDGIQI